MCEEFENKKRKEHIFFDLPERGFEPQIFGNFAAHDLNFDVKWGSPRSNQNKLLKEIGLYQFKYNFDPTVFFVVWLFAPMSIYWAQDSICCNKSGFDDHLQIRFEHGAKNVKIKGIINIYLRFAIIKRSVKIKMVLWRHRFCQKQMQLF